jgi:hypothetical protein
LNSTKAHKISTTIIGRGVVKNYIRVVIFYAAVLY